MRIKIIYTVLTIIAAFLTFSCKTYPELKNGEFISESISSSSGKVKISYSVPKNYSSHNSYPLIIVLHGHGGNAEAFGDIWKSTTDSLGVVLLSVQGNNEVVEDIGYGWSKNAEVNILSAIDYVKENIHINSDKIFVAGFSSGGSLAYYIGLKYSMQFSGFAAISAPFRAAYLDKSILNPKTKVYIGHGSLEEEYSEMSNLAEKMFNERNIKVLHKIYEGEGHSLPKPWKPTITEIVNFLVE